MPHFEKMAGCDHGGIEIVTCHGVDAEFRNVAVKEDERHADAAYVLKMLHSVAACRCHDQSIDALSDQQVDRRLFRIEFFAGIGNDHIEAGHARGIADAPDGKAEEGIFDIADHNPDDTGFARGHAAGKFVRPVFERRRSGEHLLANLVADDAIAAEHAGCGRLRDLRDPGNIGDSYGAFRGEGLFHGMTITRVVDGRSI